MFTQKNERLKPFPYKPIRLTHALRDLFSNWNCGLGSKLAIVMLQAKISYAEELDKSLFVLPESWYNEVTGSRENEFTIDHRNTTLLSESDLRGFDSPDITGSRDIDGGIMLTPDKIAKDINRQAQVSKPGHRIPYLPRK